MVKLGSNEIIELGTYISNYLHKYGIDKHNDLIINVDSNESLKKIDEDLYYRRFKEDDKEEFAPSENEINVEFNNLTLKIKVQ